MKRVLVKVFAFCSITLLQNLYVEVGHAKKDNPRTLEELKDCPCVQEYEELVLKDFGVDLEEITKKKKKKKKGQQDDEDEVENNKEKNKVRNNNNRRNRNNSSGNSRRQQQSSSQRNENRDNDVDDDWRNNEAWMNLKNPFATASMLAQNDASSDEKNGKSIEILKDLEIKTRNIERQKYRINERESVKFRQELEKYRQTLA